MKLSVIIPARNEFPNIVHTFHSITNCLEAEGFDYRDYEIIIVDNCSDEPGQDPSKPGVTGTTAHLMPRGGYTNGVVRVTYDPIAGNHTARNKGVKVARGDYIYFSDAHMAYKPGFFTHMMKAVDESGGLVHGALQFMGAYPPSSDSTGYGYTIKLGEEIKGTWNNYRVAEDWFYVPAQGHWGVMAKRQQFIDFKGYPGWDDTKAHTRSYGGGEFYLDLKWWMFGSTVAVEPKAIGYHLASSRGYSYHSDDYKYNVLAIGYALGMDDWRERAYLNWLRKGRREVMDHLMELSAKNYESERRFVDKNKKHSFNRLLIDKPWERLNDERHGSHVNSMLIFHDTWVNLIENGMEEHNIPPSPEVFKLYKESKLQQDLDSFINKHLSDRVYGRK